MHLLVGLLFWLLKWLSYVVVLLAAVMLIFASIGLGVFTLFGADHEEVPREALHTVSGVVTSVKITTQEIKREIRFRGNTAGLAEGLTNAIGYYTNTTETGVTTRHYQINLVPQGNGKATRFSIDIREPEQRVTRLTGQQVTLLYHNNLVYEVTVAGQRPHITFEETYARLSADAQQKARVFYSLKFRLLTLLVIVLALGATWLERRLRPTKSH
jgi:hypothetical protein